MLQLRQNSDACLRAKTDRCHAFHAGFRFYDQILARRNESQIVIIMPNVFQGSFEPFYHFEQRLPSGPKSEFWEIKFSIFMEKIKDVWTSLVRSYEIFSS